jgi:hypothetical protein
LAVAGLLNICALAFTIAFSGFLLIFVNWGALHSECIVKDTCDITAVRPVASQSVPSPGLCTLPNQGHLGVLCMLRCFSTLVLVLWLPR